MMTEQEKRDLLTEARMIQAALPVLGPMLERQHKMALQRLMAVYATGKVDTNIVAELSVITRIQSELNAKLSNLSIKETT